MQKNIAMPIVSITSPTMLEDAMKIKPMIISHRPIPPTISSPLFDGDFLGFLPSGKSSLMCLVSRDIRIFGWGLNLMNCY